MLLQNDEYRLGELIYFGWPIFAWTAVPLTAILHAFYSFVGNYGLAIILLTVFVRGCMFPLSRKQTLSQQKMQLLQPEIKKLQEKYKKDVEGRNKAQQELFRKHNYNPLSGCLPIFIQLPVFIGSVAIAVGGHRVAQRAVDSAFDSLVLELGRPRHALRLERLHAPVRQHGDGRRFQPWTVFESPAAAGQRAVDLAAEEDDAAACR